MKRLLIPLLMLCISLCIIAQDTPHDIIITHNAQRIDAIVTEVSATEVKYKQVTLADGPTFSIKVEDISTIIYSNGKVQAFTKKVQQPTQQLQYSPNNQYGMQPQYGDPYYNTPYIPIKKPKKQHPAPFIGISAGMGGSFGPYYRSWDGTFSFEAAGSCNKKFALGAYLKYQSVASLSTGMIFIHGDHNEGAAFIWGAGFLGGLPRRIYNYPYLQSDGIDITIDRNMYYNFGGELRLGYKFKSSWYMIFDISARYVDISTSYHSWNVPFYNGNHESSSWDDSYIIATSISIGYKFKIKQQSKVEVEGAL